MELQLKNSNKIEVASYIESQTATRQEFQVTITDEHYIDILKNVHDFNLVNGETTVILEDVDFDHYSINSAGEITFVFYREIGARVTDMKQEINNLKQTLETVSGALDEMILLDEKDEEESEG